MFNDGAGKMVELALLKVCKSAAKAEIQEFYNTRVKSIAILLIFIAGKYNSNNNIFPNIADNMAFSHSVLQKEILASLKFNTPEMQELMKKYPILMYVNFLIWDKTFIPHLILENKVVGMDKWMEDVLTKPESRRALVGLTRVFDQHKKIAIEVPLVSSFLNNPPKNDIMVCILPGIINFCIDESTNNADEQIKNMEFRQKFWMHL